MSEKEPVMNRTFVVRDAIGGVVRLPQAKYDVRARNDGSLVIDRRDDPDRIVGWYGPGQWVSTMLLTDDELGDTDINPSSS